MSQFTQDCDVPGNSQVPGKRGELVTLMLMSPLLVAVGEERESIKRYSLTTKVLKMLQITNPCLRLTIVLKAFGSLTGERFGFV